MAPTNPAIATTQEIIAELKAGRMVILVDEEDRENEGDLVMAAEHVTPEAINFMAKFGRGLICLTLTEERCRQLGLRPLRRCLLFGNLRLDGVRARPCRLGFLPCRRPAGRQRRHPVQRGVGAQHGRYRGPSGARDTPRQSPCRGGVCHRGVVLAKKRGRNNDNGS